MTHKKILEEIHARIVFLENKQESTQNKVYTAEGWEHINKRKKKLEEIRVELEKLYKFLH